jgi:hypothetical protein
VTTTAIEQVRAAVAASEPTRVPESAGEITIFRATTDASAAADDYEAAIESPGGDLYRFADNFRIRRAVRAELDLRFWQNVVEQSSSHPDVPKITVAGIREALRQPAMSLLHNWGMSSTDHMDNAIDSIERERNAQLVRLYGSLVGIIPKGL